VGGVETSRGIAYQNAQGVLTALEVLNDDSLASMRIEGTADILDIEVYRTSGTLAVGRQIKTRIPSRPWGKAPLLDAINRWLLLDIADADFEFVTDGVLGPAASELADALDRARHGDSRALANFLELDDSDPRLIRLARTKVREDVTGAEAVLAIAERQVRSILPGARTEQDLAAAARRAVDALLRDLASRAGSSEESERIVTKQRIRDLLGGVRGVPEADRWARIGPEYLSLVAQAVPNLVELNLHDDLAPPGSPAISIEDLASQDGVVLLSGRTGSGKTSAVEVARQRSAAAGRALICGHAESYVSGRLPDLVADALSIQVGRPLPTITGQQALADAGVTLVIDGASEIPAPMRNDLSEELRPIVTTPNGARVVLVGRDRATLTSLLPTSVEPRRLSLASLDQFQRTEIIRCDSNIAPLLREQPEADQERLIGDLIRRVERPLGDAAGNPMLFTMALQFAASGQEFQTDAALYGATITRLAERARVTDVDLTCAALGIVFAGLLDSGRRFVYPREYRLLLRSALDRLAGTYFAADEEAIAANVTKSGLLVPLGATQVLAPLHDSYADYLAGLAHAQGLVPLPEQLTTGDERRLEFSAQAGGLTGPLVDKIARDLPFMTVRMAALDSRRVSNTDSPNQVASILSSLLPPDDSRSPVLARVDAQIVAALATGVEPGWLDGSGLLAAAQGSSRIVLAPADSPLTAAVRLWRAALLSRIRSPEALPARKPASAEDAVNLLRQHLEQRRDHLLRLIATISPPGHDDLVRSTLGPLGLTATVTTATTVPTFSEFPIAYEHTDDITIVASTDDDRLGSPARSVSASHGSSSVDAMLRLPPNADAADRIRRALEDLTEGGWLQ
jgi:hypothetical protein